MDVTDALHIDTNRLLLRRPRTGDAVAISAYRGLPEVARYQSWEAFGIEEAERLISHQLAVKPADKDSWIQLMIVLVESGQLIGDCGIHFTSNTERQVELGITLDPRYQHRGYASEAIEGVLSDLFGRLNMHRVWAVLDVENKAAQNLFRA